MYQTALSLWKHSGEMKHLGMKGILKIQIIVCVCEREGERERERMIEWELAHGELLTILLSTTEKHDPCSWVESFLQCKRCEFLLVCGQDRQLSPPCWHSGLHDDHAKEMT